MKAHQERKHSKFSASGAERWTQCSASVALSEGLPDKQSVWAKEGSDAHEVLEHLFKMELGLGGKISVAEAQEILLQAPEEMKDHAKEMVKFVVKEASKRDGPTEIMIETRIGLPFLHPDMFGTFDSAIIEHFGRLDVFDYKYGAGYIVSPKNNLQMIIYAIGVAHLHHWNFESVRLWIYQPRANGFDGPVYWDLTIEELRVYVPILKEAIRKVLEKPELKEGSWCHWCRAKSGCPLKQEAKIEKAQGVFEKVTDEKGGIINAKDKRLAKNKIEAGF